ncbi:MAG TPA: peptidase M61 [Sphingobium sp.]|nr:peptidase M61 [Sphingobium sp.]
MRLAFSTVPLALAFTAALPFAPLAAQEPPRSAPQAQPIVSAIPPARDIAWPAGTIQLDIDASDTVRRIIRVTQTFPVGGGPLTLLFPEWIPGKHAPRGEIEKLAGLTFTADGKPVAWQRDPFNVYAFHLSVPEGARTLVAAFQFLAPTASNQGRVVMTDSLLNLQFYSMSLYPAGYYTRRIPIQARVTLPEGWTAASALNGNKRGNSIIYEETDYDTLVDSPLFAGRYARTLDLGHDVALEMFADSPEQLLATPEQIAPHRKLVDEAITLFGSRHFNRYKFLFAISDTLGGIGVEHHRSSENGVGTGYFAKWAEAIGDRDLLAHEFTHSWNGKYRRPALLWTPDFTTPMQDDLLWLYEGQTQFWGYVLAARAGLLSKAEALDSLAQIAARLEAVPGRAWRPLADTTLDPVIAARRPKAWQSWQRAEDYYNEGMMLWLEADAILRRESKGAKGLDDFARAFFGMNDGDWGVLTYSRQDVIDTLESLAPYDWAGFLRERVDQPTRDATTAPLRLSGYRLVYGETPNAATKALETKGKLVDQSYGAGFVVGNNGVVQAVVWDSPAFKAGVTIGTDIVAVGSIEYSADLLRSALRQTSDGRNPLSLLIKQGKRYRTITLDYSGGLRYPRLQNPGGEESSLDRLLSSRTGEAREH